jgi:ABC-type nitrate/sulfonate/bicarbonate transport system substrate-binding protein
MRLFHWAVAGGMLPALLAGGLACAPPAVTPAGPPVAARAPATPAGPAASPAPVHEVMITHLGQNMTHLLPLYVGLQLGHFEGEGVRLELQGLPTPTGIAAMVDGQIGYSMSGGSVIRAAASGLAVRLIAGGKSAPDWELMAQPEITSVQALRGKRLGVLAPTGAATLAAYEILGNHGIHPQDVEAINLQSSEGILSGLVARQVDAGLMGIPTNIVGRREGLRSLVRAADEVEVLQGGVGTTVQRLQERPAEVEAVLRGLLRSIAAMYEQRAVVEALMVEHFAIEPSTVAEVYDAVVPTYPRAAGASDAVIQREIAAQEETIGQKLNVTMADVVDFGPLRRAQQAIGVAPGPSR